MDKTMNELSGSATRYFLPFLAIVCIAVYLWALS